METSKDNTRPIMSLYLYLNEYVKRRLNICTSTILFRETKLDNKQIIGILISFYLNNQIELNQKRKKSFKKNVIDLDRILIIEWCNIHKVKKE